MTTCPDPESMYPIPGITRTVFLKHFIKNKNIIIGDYTYYDDAEDVNNFEKNVNYLFEKKDENYRFDVTGEKLIIGKFCQLASGVRFIMNGANHAMNGASTYPFGVLGWSEAEFHVKSKGDTIVGNDVWIGNNATIMQGITIGDGAIIGTNSLVTKNVDPYTIVGGNPAKIIRKRFDDGIIGFLLSIKWWDWSCEKIAKNISLLSSDNIDELKLLYEQSESD
eukprot:GHVL01026368.1.p1 GENE.GHVL01026368.1~~GHVL01026368.1.p1  ORF type:complete len:222 (+),score=41.64 GHVL01026368.1:118-783(+)